MCVGSLASLELRLDVFCLALAISYSLVLGATQLGTLPNQLPMHVP